LLRHKHRPRLPSLGWRPAAASAAFASPVLDDPLPSAGRDVALDMDLAYQQGSGHMTMLQKTAAAKLSQMIAVQIRTVSGRHELVVC